MWNKIKEVLGSIRFWQLVIGAIVLILADYGFIPTDLAGVIASFLGISVTVRTLDRIGSKLK